MSWCSSGRPSEAGKTAPVPTSLKSRPLYSDPRSPGSAATLRVSAALRNVGSTIKNELFSHKLQKTVHGFPKKSSPDKKCRRADKIMKKLSVFGVCKHCNIPWHSTMCCLHMVKMPCSLNAYYTYITALSINTHLT